MLDGDKRYYLGAGLCGNISLALSPGRKREGKWKGENRGRGI